MKAQARKARERLARLRERLAHPKNLRVLGPGLFLLGMALVAVGLLVIPSGGNGGDEPASGETVAESEPEGVGGTAFPVPAEAVPGYLHLVPPLQPWADFTVEIDRLGVKARVVTLNMDDRRVPQVPNDAKNLAWYEWSSAPGEGSNAVMAGHVRWGGERGVFADLQKLETGDAIRVKWNDGREMLYEVTNNFEVEVADRNSLLVMAPTPEDTLTLITCGGDFVAQADNPLGGDFTDRTVVRARLVEANVAAGP